MKRRSQLGVFFISLLLTSCSVSNKRSYEECSTHYLQAQHDYCSTNVMVAEEGLGDYIQWVSDTNHPCEPWLDRNFVIFHEYGRWFLIKEYLGETNNAEILYKKSLTAYNAYLQGFTVQGKAPPAPAINSKEELRMRLAHQDKDLEVGWRK